MHKDITGQQADLFKNRNLYFIYRLEDGSFLERQYSLLTYQDNTELDKLLREYLALPGVRESYMPVLSKNADDIQSAYVSFETKDGHYQDFEITEDMQGFLDVYKKDILAEDSLKSMFRESEPYDYDVYVRIDFKNELLNRTGAHSNRLYNQFENTMNYLVDKGIIKLEDLMESEYNLKYSPAAIAIPR